MVGVDPAADPFAAETRPPEIDRSRIDVPSADGSEWSAPPPPLPPPAPVQPPAPVFASREPSLDAPPPARSGARRVEPETSQPAGPDGKPLIRGGMLVLGCAAASAAGSLYSWHLQGQREERLSMAETRNETAQTYGLPLEDTGGLRGEVRLYRGLAIGLAVTAGVLAIVGGSVALAGVRQRNRARAVVLRLAGGLGWEVRF
ncbi:hypothetical protein [Nannocystis bainbridge]|uniref:Uncharacterized protein n=1 Tax=Nannocystis bainbridge TaxID=2995303 RepID=A0ABT5E803_9BACT|nr:hypothetical protein [Nannocystis bainbridge]MDC0721984.1 hypothetical protein [Nannocystis bainbridge]